jgi:hypothetical protein
MLLLQASANGPQSCRPEGVAVADTSSTADAVVYGWFLELAARGFSESGHSAPKMMEMVSACLQLPFFVAPPPFSGGASRVYEKPGRQDE